MKPKAEKSIRRRRLVAGLDPSLGGCATVVYDGRKILGQCHICTKPADGSHEARIAWITKQTMKVLLSVPVSLVMIEGYAYSKNTQGGAALQELCGVLKHRMFRKELLFYPTPSTTLKLWATGNGHATKQEMLDEARKTWPECPNFDLADAYHLARYGWATYDSIVEPA